MRSILFFLVVFSCLMAVLYFFVEKDGRPAPEMLDDFEPLAESAESMAQADAARRGEEEKFREDGDDFLRLRGAFPGESHQYVWRFGADDPPPFDGDDY